MRAQEFIVERDEWVHMDPPEVARWREQARVQGITSGPESTLSALTPPAARSSAALPKPNVTASKPAANTDVPQDEYWAATPSKLGGAGRNKKPDQTELDRNKRDVEISTDYMDSKKSDWYVPKDSKTAVPKEKNRT